jgi:hypothetical protein
MQYIHKYTRNRRGDLNGVVLATKNITGQPAYGWALCRKGDKFDKQFGLNIALNRALVGSSARVPHSIRSEFDEIQKRGVRYFKP